MGLFFLPPPLLKDMKNRSWQLPDFLCWVAQVLCTARPLAEPVAKLCFGGVLQHVMDVVKSVSAKHNTLNAARSPSCRAGCALLRHSKWGSPPCCSDLCSHQSCQMLGGATARLETWHLAHSLPIPHFPEQVTAGLVMPRGKQNFPWALLHACWSPCVCRFPDHPVRSISEDWGLLAQGL